MFFLAPLIGAAASALGGALGEAFASSGRAKQEELLRSAMDELGNIDPVVFEQLVAEQLGPSAVATKTDTDPRLTSLQNEGLDAYSEIINDGGLDPMARADLYRANSAAARTAGAGINRIQQSMDDRGMGNSGASVVLQAKAAQEGAQQAHGSSLDAAARAWERRMQALGQRTGLAGQMRSQEFGEKARRAEAEDSVARYNADSRTAAGRYRDSMKQQQFDNQFRVADAKARAATGRAEQEGRNADRTAGYAQRAGNFVGGVVDQVDQLGQADDYRKWESEEREKDRKAGYRPYGY